MNKFLLSSIFCALSLILSAQNYVQNVTLISTSGTQATFVSTGMSTDKSLLEENAVQSLIYTLFYSGVPGINEGKPLVTNDNPTYTRSFFKPNEKKNPSKYVLFVASMVETGASSKISGQYRADYNITLYLTRLINDLKTNKVHEETLTVENIDETVGLTKPTIMVVPFTKDGETYDTVLMNDYDRRIAVSRVQDGFESRDITTIDILAKLQAEKRQQNYELDAATSNDRSLLLSSGADVYVTVDMQKQKTTDGKTRISLIMKAYERVSGDILASKDGWTNPFNTTSTDALCAYAVKDLLPSFLNDICKNFTERISKGSRVVLRFAINSSSGLTMNSTKGPHNYSISNIIRQWVRKNSFNGKYHLQGIVDESMIFDYVNIPPKDTDGLLMDAAQFAFLLESHLKEDNGINCSTKIEGNTIYFSILD